MPFDGQVVIVTGAGSGIGRATAELLASEGASVVIAEIDETSGPGTEDAIRRAGGKAFFIRTDVAVEDSVNAMVRSAAAAGPVFGLVNNAGIDVEIPLLAMSAADWDRVLAVNLRGVFFCARAALPHMRANGGGSIVNISSVHAAFGFEGCAAYDAGKGGMVSLTRTIALENGPYGIRANVICPGYIDTPMWDVWLAQQRNPAELDRQTREWHPLRRRGTPLDVARAVRFLLSEDSAWIAGANLVVDGGLSVRYFGY